jgi:hypothetical protein
MYTWVSSKSAMKRLGKDGATRVPIAVPPTFSGVCVHLVCMSLSIQYVCECIRSARYVSVSGKSVCVYPVCV